MKNKIKLWCGAILMVAISLTAASLHFSTAKNPSQKGDYWLGKLNPIESDIADFYGPLPGGPENRNGVRIQEGEDWQVYRLFPSGYLEIFHRNQMGAYVRIDLPISWQRETYPMLIFPLDGRLYVVSYDVVRNVPSGRRLSVSQPGFDLFEIDPEKKDPLRLLANGLDLGAGIDSLVYGRMTPSSMSICAENKCVIIDRNGIVQYWSLDGLRDYELVEVSFDVDSAYAIVRERWDDRTDGPITEKNQNIPWHT